MFVNWLTDSDSYLLLADNKLDEGDILIGASCGPGRLFL